MQHAMVIPADARAMGAVTGLNRGKRFGTRIAMSDYRTGNRAGECVSYFKDDKSDATIFKPSRTRKPNRRRNAIIAQRNDIALMAKMGTIHSPNDL